MLYTSARCYNFGAEICICATSRFLIAGVSQCRVVSHMLVSSDAWRICNPEAYYSLDYSNAGNHLGVTMVTHIPL